MATMYHANAETLEINAKILLERLTAAEQAAEELAKELSTVRGATMELRTADSIMGALRKERERVEKFTQVGDSARLTKVGSGRLAELISYLRWREGARG